MLSNISGIDNQIEKMVDCGVITKLIELSKREDRSVPFETKKRRMKSTIASCQCNMSRFSKCKNNNGYGDVKYWSYWYRSIVIIFNFLVYLIQHSFQQIVRTNYSGKYQYIQVVG